MRTISFLGVVLVCSSLTSAASAQSAATRVAPGKGWLNDLDKGKALAAKTGKPLMVVFRCDP